MHINALSANSLLAIFSRLYNFTYLSTIPLVCTKWNTLHPAACRAVRYLRLIPWINPWMNAPSVQHGSTLVATFPNVTMLELMPTGFSTELVHVLVHLLQHYTHLVSLHLMAILDNGEWPESAAFLAALNRLTQLKHFRLITRQSFPELDAPTIPIFAQLHSITFQLFDIKPIFRQALLKYAASSVHLKQLSFHVSSNEFAAFTAILLDDQLSSKIVDLETQHLDTAQLTFITERCLNIRDLFVADLFIDTLYHRMAPLVNLPYLDHLSLGINLIHINPPLLNIPRDDGQPRPLATVRSLHLSLDNISLHTHLATIVTRFEATFPNLRRVTIYGLSSCTHCRQSEDSQFDGVEESCKLIMLQGLARISTLETVRENLEKEWLPQLRDSIALDAVVDH